jgi:hypothetical protein
MKRTFLLLAMAMLMAMPSFAGAKKKAEKDTEHFRYEIECAGNGTQGTYLVKVWSYSKRPSVAAEQCMKNAVHGVIFKGYTGGNGCVAQRPLASHPGVEMEYEEYFRNFLSDKGEYYKYVSLTGATQEIIKVGKEYKVGIIVSVQKDELRKALEQAGVIRGLGSGF